MAGRLKDKTAIVTGGGSGIGKAICLRFAQEDAQVAVLEVNAQAGEQTVGEIKQSGGEAMQFECNVADQQQVMDVFDQVEQKYGGVDVLVNNAGIAHIGTVEATTEEDFDRIYDVNVKGVYNCLKAGVSKMKGRGGAILNLASIVSCVGIPDRFAYSMSKGAVLTMTYSVACDYVKQKIRCNSIAPGRVHTPFVDGFIKANYPGNEQEMFEKLAKTQPIGRMGQPDEIASLALFLCSDEAAFITGSNYAIDGGFMGIKV